MNESLIGISSKRTLTRRRPTDPFFIASLANDKKCLLPFDFKMLEKHMAVLGCTGSGKSYFIESLLRQMIDQHCGFLFIDPHGLSAHRTLAYCQKMFELGTYSRHRYQSLHYLECGPERVFSLDPFRRPEFSKEKEVDQVSYEAWLTRAVDDFALAVQRMHHDVDFKGMPQLERFLKNALTVVATTIDEETKQHLPLSDVFSLFFPDHPRHTIVYSMVASKLPPNIRADLDSLKRLSDNRQEELTRSTVNRLRSLLSPLVSQVFYENAQQFDFAKAIKGQHQVILNVEPTNCFSESQATAVANICINSLRSTIRSLEIDENRRFYLIIDEVAKFVGKDVISMLKEDRKRGLSVILLGQDYDSFRIEGECDLVKDIHNNTGAFISFQQKDPQDCRDMADFFAMPMYNLSERLQPMVVPVEPKLGRLLDESYGIGNAESKSKSFSKSQQRHNSVANSESSSQSESQSQSRSQSTGSSSNRYSGFSRSDSIIPISAGNGESFSLHTIPNSSVGTNVGHGTGSMESSNFGNSTGSSSSSSKSSTTSEGFSEGSTVGDSVGSTTSSSHSKTFKQVLIPQHEIAFVPTGTPVKALDYQLMEWAQKLTCLNQGECFIRTKVGSSDETSLQLKVLAVQDPYDSWQEYANAIATMKTLLVKPYHRTPVPMLMPADRTSSTERIDGVKDSDFN